MKRRPPGVTIAVMDGVHDMGGVRERFGPIPREANEPVFHDRWEGRVYGMRQAVGPVYRLGAHRYAIERLPAGVYLGSSYYEKWLRAFTTCLLEAGIIGDDELQAKLQRFEADPAAPAMEHDDPAVRDRVLRRVFRKSIVRKQVANESPRFRPGDAVLVRDLHPRGHIRLPGYLKGKTGTIERYNGYYDVHDHERHDEPLPPPEPLYSVRFDRLDIWGSGSEPGQIVADLTERYLEPARRGRT